MYAICHIPTGKFPVEDEGGSYLAAKEDGALYCFYVKKLADDFLKDFKISDTFYDEISDKEYNIEGFEVVKLEM